MIRFRMLGTLNLRDSQGREFGSVLRRRKLLALLAYLAVARPPGFHRRDTLVALLWPELDHAHARNALRQAVHSLRQGLGRDVLVSRGEDELGVNEERLGCDVREFEAALEIGQPEKSLELYRGTLLNGLYVSGAPGFERWLDLEREHLRRRAIDAAELLIDREAAASNPVGAARWALRHTELSPDDESAVRRLIQLLDRSGDRASAVRAYEDFEKRLARDLELRPSSETRALVDDIRTRLQREGAAAGTLSDLAGGDESGVEAAARRRIALWPSASATDESSGTARSGEGRMGAAPRRSLQRKRVARALALGLGGLLIGGWLVFRPGFGARSVESGPNPKDLVVLPFANLGPAEDEYFADGITEEIAARLAAIDRLRVIGRMSAGRHAHKTPQEIGTELGVDYILEGTVRWQKSVQGPARVRVTPQLVSVSDGAQLWAAVYDEPLDEIFRVQSEIARMVVQALDVALLEPQRRVVDAEPTRSLEAYDYYLRGNDYMRRATEDRDTRTALRMYEKAVELDPGFALAYARLSRMHSRMYWFHYDRSEDRLVEAKKAVDRSFELEPGLPEGHLAMGTYFLGLLDYDRAKQEYAIAQASRPNEPYIFLARAVLRTRDGTYREMVEDFEGALRLDPGSASLVNNAAEGYGLVRHFARAEALHDRAIALGPDWSYTYYLKGRLYLLWEGSTEKARAVLDEARGVGVADAPRLFLTRFLVDLFDGRYDEVLSQLSSGAPDVIEDQFRFIPKAQLHAQVYGLMGRRDLERAYYDSARGFVYRKMQEWPEDSRLRSALGIAYAGLGLKQQAIQEGEKAVELLPIRKEAYRGYYRAMDLAQIYTMVGEHDAAVELLEHLLSIPGHLTAAWLRIDPTWDPLRGHPRFQALLRQAA